MMPTITLEELAALEKLANERLGSKSVYANVTIYARTLQQLCAAARRGVEADAEIAQLRRVIERGRDSTRTELLLSEQLSEQRAGNIKLLERAEKAKAELAALKVERLVLAKECIEAWESAVDWSSYASEYFRAKHGADKDQDRLDAARDRLAILELQAEREPAIKAAQPQEHPSAAARRGVEAETQIAAWKREELEWHDRHDKDRIRLGECESQRDAALQRAEKAEAELAALKAAQPQEYPSSADDEATRWRHGETALAEALAGFEGKPLPERVSVPVSDERIMEIAKSVGMQGMLSDVVTTTDELKAFARALLAAAQEGK